MRVGARTDVGRLRTSNQDVGFADERLGLFVVADGMGGHNGGEIASQTAVKALVDFPWDTVKEPRDLQEPFARANLAVWQKAGNSESLKGMGTTLTLAKVVGEKVFIGHVGDSRAYVIHGDGCSKQLTDDHSVVGQLVRDGRLTEGEARLHPQRNLLTNALGTHPDVMVDVTSIRPAGDDIILLCTDGLVNEVAVDEMAEICLHSSDLQIAADRLVGLANERGGRDNITVVIFSLK